MSYWRAFASWCFMQKISLSSKFFLFGCAFLPFFNDFPLLEFITPSFLDFSLPFYIVAVFLLMFESVILGRDLSVNRNAFVFFCIAVLAAGISLISNYSKSSVICGVDECGSVRMFKTLLSDTIKFFLVPFFVLFINKVGMERLVVYIRRGFYISCAYVFVEIFLSLIPAFLGFGRFELMNSIDSLFHARINDWGPLRTRGLSFEPGYQGAFLIFCLPFVFSDCRERVRARNLLLWLVCLFTTGAPGAFFAAIIFFISFKYDWINARLVKMIFVMTASVFSLLFFYAMLGLSEFISTITRTGSWVASISAIFDNAFLGVGPGMSGYWLINYYPDFFYNSPEAGGWWQSGIDYMNAPTFSSLFNYVLNYGVLPVLVVSLFFYFSGFWRNVFYSNYGRSAFFSFFVVSFTITSYQVLAYLLFLSVVFCNGWVFLDRLGSKKIIRTS